MGLTVGLIAFAILVGLGVALWFVVADMAREALDDPDERDYWERVLRC
jgi:hypothetical protein